MLALSTQLPKSRHYKTHAYIPSQSLEPPVHPECCEEHDPTLSTGSELSSHHV